MSIWLINMNILDSYYKKTIDYKFLKTNLKFKVSQALFSSHSIDTGTKRLLRTFITSKSSFNKILDVGCGYGPIGITLKAVGLNSKVHMIDRDALALEYSKLNARLNNINNINNIKIYGSLGYDDVSDADFDLIISNIPAKVGRNTLAHLLIDARFFLKKNGVVAIVVVDSILEDDSEILLNSNVEIILKKHITFNTKNELKFSNTAS